MTWLWVIIVVALIGGIIGYMSSGKAEDAAAGAATAGCISANIILQIFLALLSFYILFRIGAWLFS